MKFLLSESYVKIPENGKFSSLTPNNWWSNLLNLVTVTVKARTVYVKGPLGELTKSFKHIPCEMKFVKMNTKKL